MTMMMISLSSMCWWRKNIILMLLSLELLIMSLYTLMMHSMNMASLSSLLIMLAMMVSGSSMGLSLLIALSHTFNSSNSLPINLMTFDKNNINNYYNHNYMYL